MHRSQSALEIRRVRPADRERILELHENALRDAGAFIEGGPDGDLRDPIGSYVDEGGEFLVGELVGVRAGEISGERSGETSGERASNIVAMGALRPIPERTRDAFESLATPAGELKRMRVDPERQRSGLGSALLSQLEGCARAKGYRELVLDTGLDQAGARAFYESKGFEHETDVTVTVDAGEFGLALYRKRLD